MTLPNEINSLLVSTTDGYKIERSLRFNIPDSAYLNRTFGSPTNAFIFTISVWVKRSGSSINIENIFGVGTGAAAATSWIGFTNDILYLSFQDASYFVSSSALYRDPGAWYHIVAAVDTTQATASDRVKLYVNGSQLTAVTASYPPQNSSWQMNGAYYHVVGARYRTSIDSYFNGYITDFNFVDGQALTPSSFGETSLITGVWQPKKYIGTYGNNGFYLKFADNSGTTSTTLGKDSSGNGNNWTPNNFSVTSGAGNDSMTDTPTLYSDGGNGRGNYSTLNSVNSLTTVALSNGNLDYSSSTVGQLALATIGISTRKWYWEVSSTAGTTETQVGVYGTSASSLYSLEANSTVYGIRFDADNGTLDRTSDGTNWTSIATGLTSGPYFPYFYNNGSTAKTVSVNFGQRGFNLSVPSGYRALNTQNLPTPAVQKSRNYTDIVTYTGTGASLTPTSSLGFSPDLVWIKGRSGATDNAIYDTSRGVQLDLVSNTSGAETTETQGLTAFNSNGFTVGTLSKVNTISSTYVAWCWDKSATPGFDIVTYTGNGVNRTISHSLGVAPSLVLVKQRGSTTGWVMWHTSIPATNYIPWSYAGSSTSGTTYWNSTAPTSSVFSLGTSTDVNANAGTYVAYLWANVDGFSKVGSFTGNGSSDGPFVYCGFKPRWLMLHSGDSWLIFDSTRDTYNPTATTLWSNLSNAESANYVPQDFFSNGFKIRSSSTSTNTSGGTVYFVAFAESPFKYSLAR